MPGQCAIAQTPNGHHLFTSGVDATLRLHDIRPSITPNNSETWWQSDSSSTEPDLGDIPASDAHHDKPITALAITANGTTLASASSDGFLRFFSVSAPSNNEKPQLSFDQSCARFSAPVRCIAFSGSGAFIAVAGEEPGLIKVVMTAQPASVNVMRAPSPSSPAHDAIVDLAFDSAGDYVVTVGERGCAAVWDIEQSCLLSTVDLNGRKAKCVTWSPDGSSLLIGTDKGAVIVSKMRWFVDFQLEDVDDGDDGDDGDDDDIFGGGNKKTSGKKTGICAVDWSSNGRYVLTASKDGSVLLWDVVVKKVLGSWKAEEVVQLVRWHNKANAFVIIDQNGQFGIVDSVVPSHFPSPITKTSLIELPTVPTDVGGGKIKKKRSDNNDDDDEDGNAKVKRSKNLKEKRQKMQERKRKAKEAKEKREVVKKGGILESEAGDDGAVDDDGGDDDDDQGLENGFSLSDVDADDEDEGERGSSQSLGSQDSEDYASDLDDEEVHGEFAGLENDGAHLTTIKRGNKAHGNASGRNNKNSRLSVAPIVQVAPFMPSSTPLHEKTSTKARILVWNLVGAVLSFDENTHDVVEVEFSDATRRSIGIKDHYGYTVGCLSETGVLLGSPRTKEHGSVVTFRPFSAWALNADWTQFMPEDEDIAIIALGQRFAAVATTPHNIVRIFSLSGIQTTAYGVSGPVVTACAMGDYLAIVYHTDTLASTLNVEILDINSLGEIEGVLFDGPIKICGTSSDAIPSTRLEWIGFTTDTNDFCTYDSNGWVWMLTDLRHTKRWVPVIQNAAKCTECDWFWAASMTSEQFIGAPCLSNERHPPAKPRPGLRSLHLSAPVIDRISKNGKPTVAERLARTRLKIQRLMANKQLAEELCEGDVDEDEDVEEADEAVSRMELESDKCILALMEDACRKEHNMRALDLSTRLNCKISFKYAIELAKHFKRTALVSRVEHVAAQKISIIDEEIRAKERKLLLSGNHNHQPQINFHDHDVESQATAVVGTSPVSMQHGISTPRVNASGTDDGHGRMTMKERQTLFESDEEREVNNDLKTPPPAQRHTSSTRKNDVEGRVSEKKKPSTRNNDKAMGVLDVTDDEEEVPQPKSRTTTTSTAATKKTKVNSNCTKPIEGEGEMKEVNRGTKRRVEASTSKGITNSTTTGKVTKKSKIGGESTTKPANPKFMSMKNRFLKK